MNKDFKNPTIETQGYFSDKGLHDECFRANENIREHWQRLMGNIEGLGIKELKIREQELLKLLQENGVTYNVYGDPDGLNRPWQLDAVPLILSSEEWKTTEKGLKQRAYVLDKLLEDLYGERTLIKKGIIPPELIYGHSGFLRACTNIKLPGKNKLILYAADLSRGPDGKVWVLKDRTQAPSGMGYALENRRTLSRVLPELFMNHNVSKLGFFFNTLMQALQQISPHAKEQPRIVLLTPGPSNETYFEHAFLASYLGLTLAQGDDLLVRDGFVWIKTIEGLDKVDIILRRVDDTYCDPLELREDSQLGIPGLLEVIRKGNVAIANPIGSGILENTGLMAFMHNIVRHFLNEDPILSMVATWWCGQKKEMDFVINNIDKLVIKRTDRLIGSDTVIGNQLTKAQKEELIRKIKTQPYLYVGQEEVGFSTAPVFTNEKFEPRLSVLRTYMVASKTGEYQAMPGGLTRCSPKKGSFLISNQDGGISKDTWIEGVEEALGYDEISHFSHDLKRKNVLPSRAGENLFWVGRYSQRVLRTSRFIRIVLRNLSQTNYLNTGPEAACNKILLQAITHLTASYPGFLEKEKDSPLDEPLAELHQVICNPSRQGSILFSLNNLLKSMYAVRNRWSLDNWRVIDEIENIKKKLSLLEPDEIRQVFNLLDQLNVELLSFAGMNRDSMYREEGWILYRMGKILENLLLELSQYRAVLSIQYEESFQFKILEALLVSNQNLTNYRSVYRTYFDMAPVLDLLFFNKQNPSSLLYQLEELSELAEKLPNTETQNTELNRQLFEAYSLVRLASIDQLLEVEKDNYRKHLDEFCEKLSTLMYSIASKLNDVYFSHTTYQYQGSKGGFQFEV
ncbi:MAG TPA: circularly permuted type 2 ATP-grasp protein [Cytophagaceae bacterium]|jgi:uncharacterized circularly permuted ATP-grasp superfamily protein/uncharacterized alpha-E superfamily protein|nr:circularly permuted type 2 ATP-grasp protein [Cytophagaceae bacterium]